MRRTALTLSVGLLGLLVLAGPGVALEINVTSPQKPVTVQMQPVPGLKCSVTEYGPSFDFVTGSGTGAIVYGGGVSCLNGVGIKTVNVYVQVRSSTNPFEWFIKSSTQVTTGPRRQNPARITVMNNAVRGHTYRVVATGTVTWNGKETGGATISEAWTA